MHSSSSNNAVRHRSCTQSPSQSGKDNDNTNAHRNPSGGHGGGNTIGGGCGNVDDENDGSSGSHYGIGGSINDNTTVGTTKLHGRRYSQRPPRWKNIHKTTLVLGMAVTLPTLCLLGMYMSSTSLDSLKIGSSPHFRHGDDVSSKARLGSKHNNIRRGERGGGDEIMEFFERKMKRRKYNDYEPATNSHNDENEEEEEDNDNSIDKDKTDTEFDKEEVQTSRQPALSSHTGGGRIANNSQELQYQYPPRMLRLELQKQFSNKMSGGETDSTRTSRGGKPKLSHGDVLLSTVHRLPTYESRDIPPSERYITPYPDDDGYMDRLESVKKSKKYRNNEREALEDDVCTAKHAWQADAYPNCNLLHEYELGQLTGMFGRALRRNLRKNEGDGDELVKYLASGYWRDVWLLSKASGSFVDGGGSSSITEEANNTPMETNMTIIEKEEITVLKTLRFKHDFTDRNYDRHRKDALASMRMSQSPNVVDIYAYCSNSAVFEYGKGGDIDAKLWPYDKEEEKYYVADIPSLEKVDLGMLSYRLSLLIVLHISR